MKWLQMEFLPLPYTASVMVADGWFYTEVRIPGYTLLNIYGRLILGLRPANERRR